MPDNQTMSNKAKCQIIKKCSLTIGGNVISELYGQWIEIWHEMWQDTAAKNNFDLMTGHQPDLFLPAHNGRNRGFYPTSTLEKYLNTNPDSNNYTFTNFKKMKFHINHMKHSEAIHSNEFLLLRFLLRRPKLQIIQFFL